jgi:signal transduction histidine kinase
METIREKNAFLGKYPLVMKILDVLPFNILILTPERQIVFANRVFSQKINEMGASPEEVESGILGQNPGQALHCDRLEPGGCSMSVFCNKCGVTKAIASALAGIVDSQDCRFTFRDRKGDAHAEDWRVWAYPLPLEQETFMLMTLVDISDSKRREVLERTFFHDIHNMAGGIQGLALMLPDMVDDRQEVLSTAGLLGYASGLLLDEINAQRTLYSAERNELQPCWKPLELVPFLNNIGASYAAHEVARQRHIQVDPAAEPVLSVATDPALLSRIIVNLLKNALEASPPGHTVRISFEKNNDRVRIHVRNTAVIPAAVQLQVFSRSFSTKGSGRGLGTYSVKLLTERYLKGTASFVSNETHGTVFTVELPLNVQSTSRTEAQTT